jgi:hypothetical protein
MPEDGNVGFRDLVVLDFTQIGSMQGKTEPAWCGEWEGLGFIGLVSGKFMGRDRCFVIVRGDDGGNELWELMGTEAAARGDVTESGAESRVRAYVETPRRDFGEPRKLKRLERVDVMLAGIDGDVELEVFWRCDSGERWNRWDGAVTCAVTSDGSSAEPHVWKNLKRQGRAQWRTFTIPDGVDVLTRRGWHIGYSFQLRLAWRGCCRVERVLLRASMVADTDFAGRETWIDGAVEEDVTGNDILYKIGD